jgi:hypothetical protein
MCARLADMKTWSCLGNPPRPQDLHTFPCVGPEHKAINVVFSGYATLEKALAAATPAAGDACKPSDKTYCDAQVASMVPWQVPTKKEAIAQMTAPGSVWAATCQTCLDPPKQVPTRNRNRTRTRYRSRSRNQNQNRDRSRNLALALALALTRTRR